MQSHIVIGLGLGDEGKGLWTDYLTRKHRIRNVVRFNGGAQALHHVTLPDGTVHGFSQFGAGTFVPGVRTIHSRHVLLEPLSLIAEAATLKRLGVEDPLARLRVSASAPLIPHSNVLLNRAMEASRGGGRHGSCGLGIGLTQGNVEELGPSALYMGDALRRESHFIDKVLFMLEWAREDMHQWECEASREYIDALRSFDVYGYVDTVRSIVAAIDIVPDASVTELIANEECVFEGAQGVLLDQTHGFFPYCTRSNTTPENARALLREAGFGGEVTVHGLLRGYATRHGAGPFPTEDTESRIPPCDNKVGPWQGAFRQGHFDAVLARYALEVVGGVDNLVITNLDRMVGLPELKIGVKYTGTDPCWYDSDTENLKAAPPLQAGIPRTEMLSGVGVGYLVIPGWRAGDYAGEERYISFLEDQVEHPVTGISRDKTARKTQRHSNYHTRLTQPA